MRNIKVIENTLFDIAQALAANEQLQKLLVLDDNSLEGTFVPLSIQEVLEQEYISVCPFVENGIVNSQRNTFLVIHFDDFSFRDQNTRVNGVIYVCSDKQHVVLSNNRHRLLEIIGEINKTIGDKKFSAAGEIIMDHAESVSISEFVFSYRLSFHFNDQESFRKAEL